MSISLVMYFHVFAYRCFLSLVHTLKISLENSVKRCLELWRMQHAHHSFYGGFSNTYIHVWKETMKITHEKTAEYANRNECRLKWTKSVKICQEVEQVQLCDILWNKIISVARLHSLHIFNKSFTVFFNVCTSFM